MHMTIFLRYLWPQVACNTCALRHARIERTLPAFCVLYARLLIIGALFLPTTESHHPSTSEALFHHAGLAGTKRLTPEELLGSDKNREALIKAGLWKQSFWYRLKQRMQPPKLEGQEGDAQRLCWHRI